MKLETQYVLSINIYYEPISDKELDVILRDEAFLKESFFINGKFQHDLFAKFLISEYHIIRIADILHIYIDGYYSDKQDDIERLMIKHIPGLKRYNDKKRYLIYSYRLNKRIITSELFNTCKWNI